VALAAERTLLSWTRTGVSLVALGIVLAKFMLYIGQLGHATGSMRGLGMGLVLGGGLLTVAAGIRHLRVLSRWARGQPIGPSPLLALLVVGTVVAAAIYALVSIAS